MTLSRHILLRVLPVVVALALIQVAAGFALVVHPLLDDHAARFADDLVQAGGSASPLAGVRWSDVPPPDGGRSYLPYNLLLAQRLRERTQETVEVHAVAGATALYFVRVEPADAPFAVFDHRQMVGALPAQALSVWILTTLLGGGAAAIWLSRSLSRPIADMEYELGAANLQQTARRADPVGIAELDALRKRYSDLWRELDEAVENRTTLLMGLAHDLRSPLTRMRLELEIACELSSDPRCRRMRDDVSEMSRIVQGFVDAASALGSEASTAIELASIADWIGSSFAAEPRVRVERASDAGPLRVNLPALERIVTNLIQNAIDHAPDGPIVCTLGESRGAWRFDIEDRGPGMTPQQWDDAFRPFHGKGSGNLGLGLALSRLLAQQNGWTLVLEPRAERGLRARLVVAGPPASSP